MPILAESGEVPRLSLIDRSHFPPEYLAFVSGGAGPRAPRPGSCAAGLTNVFNIQSSGRRPLSAIRLAASRSRALTDRREGCLKRVRASSG